MLASVTILFLLINFHSIITFGIKDHPQWGKICTMNREYQDYFFDIWMWSDTVLYSFAPSIVLIICNSAIVFMVIKSRAQRRSNLSTGQGQPKISSLTIMLVVVATSFVMTTAPLGIQGAIHFAG